MGKHAVATQLDDLGYLITDGAKGKTLSGKNFLHRARCLKRKKQMHPPCSVIGTFWALTHHHH